jgi:hypothetical protein
LPVFSTSGAPSIIRLARLSPGVQSDVTRIAAPSAKVTVEPA